MHGRSATAQGTLRLMQFISQQINQIFTCTQWLSEMCLQDVVASSTAVFSKIDAALSAPVDAYVPHSICHLYSHEIICLCNQVDLKCDCPSGAEGGRQQCIKVLRDLVKEVCSAVVCTPVIRYFLISHVI